VIRGAVRAVLLAGALLPAAAAPAAAAPHLVGIEDERLLLHSPGRAAEAVAEWAAAGIDVVRIHARWNEVAPEGRRRPAGFDAGDHTDRRYEWRDLDRGIGLVRAAGLEVMLTVTGPGPLWTSRKPSARNPRHRPDALAYAAFARAVATRYRDSVDSYLVWNEPNIPGWLDPQVECTRSGKCERVAPHLYRQLLQAAYPAIKAADPGAEVVMGELAPIGRESRSEALTVIPPLTFLRTMACLDERYRPMPRKGYCRSFRTVRADALGHHPHGVESAPDEPSEDRRWAKIADLPRLLAALDRITATGRFDAPTDEGFDVHLTEFGYQTSPPDHAIGITLEEQQRFVQQAAYIAWKTPRVRSLVHYQWVDEPVRFRAPGQLAYAGWQSGLHFVDGRPKPVMDSFLSPFVVVRFDETGGRVAERVPAGRTLIDGTRSGEVGDEVLRDRRHLAGDGLVVPVVAIGRQSGTLEETPDVITRGFVVDTRTEALLKEIPSLLASSLESASVEERTDPGLIKERLRVDLQRFFRKRSGLRPLVLPVIMEI
jgi:hypothetical protein